MGSISTSFSGNFYTIIGSVTEARAELNRINAKIDKVVSAGTGDGDIIYTVGRM